MLMETYAGGISPDRIGKNHLQDEKKYVILQHQTYKTYNYETLTDDNDDGLDSLDRHIGHGLRNST